MLSAKDKSMLTEDLPLARRRPSLIDIICPNRQPSSSKRLSLSTTPRSINNNSVPNWKIVGTPPTRQSALSTSVAPNSYKNCLSDRKNPNSNASDLCYSIKQLNLSSTPVLDSYLTLRNINKTKRWSFSGNCVLDEVFDFGDEAVIGSPFNNIRKGSSAQKGLAFDDPFESEQENEIVFSLDDYESDSANSQSLINKNSCTENLGKHYYKVEFKYNRKEVFQASELLEAGALVTVEADRGIDLGRVADKVEKPKLSEKHKSILKAITKYNKSEVEKKLREKESAEEIALELCREKVRERNLPMTILTAEYQWDRKKITFYFNQKKNTVNTLISTNSENSRVDFRELVKDLFKVYKTRIWMCSISNSLGI